MTLSTETESLAERYARLSREGAERRGVDAALRTLDVIVPLEGEVKVPVVSSTPHGLMNGVRLLGVSPRAQGYGMVLAKA